MVKGPAQTKSSRTRATILQAARGLFSELGFDNTTIRKVADRAAIDPALVMRYFGNKEGLFAAATDFDLNLPDLSTRNRDEVGTALVRHFLTVWEDSDAGIGMTVLLRSAASSETASAKVQEIFASQVTPAIALLADGGSASKRAALVSSQLIGLAMCRYILRLAPMVAMSGDDLVREMGPTIQRYLAA